MIAIEKLFAVVLMVIVVLAIVLLVMRISRTGEKPVGKEMDFRSKCASYLGKYPDCVKKGNPQWKDLWKICDELGYNTQECEKACGCP